MGELKLDDLHNASRWARRRYCHLPSLVYTLRLASHIAKTPDPTLKTAFRRNLRSILGDPEDFLADRCIPVPVGSASYVRVSSPMD
ncbi:hypothetical protein SK128_013952, partial [Halocaridina rubra]